MVYICLTADYEVCLGENYFGIDEVLLEPSTIIANSLNAIGVPITFFVDSLYADYLRRNGEFSDYEALKANVCQLYSQGNDIQLHIHPSWLHSSQEDNKVVFDLEFYSLPNYDRLFGKGTIADIVEQSIRILQKDLMKDVSDYSPVAYRAGGWCIQEETEIIRALRSNGILIDSSVYKEKYTKAPRYSYMDYRHAPRNDLWLFNQEVLKPSNLSYGQSMLQFPVYVDKGLSAYFYKWYSIFKRKIKHIPSAPRRITGKGCLPKDITVGDRLKLFLCEPIYYSLDWLDKIDYYVRHIRHLGKEKQDHFVCFYFHPKLFDCDRIADVCDALKELPADKCTFVTMKDIDTMLRKGYRV